VKVMLRVSDNQPEGDKASSYLSIDKKKRQVTLSEPTTTPAPQTSTNAQDARGPMVSAPKMFAFDALHTSEDSQVKYYVIVKLLAFPHDMIEHMKNRRC
jgi:kinesin family member 26